MTASDADGNAVGEERTARRVSEPFTVDNTPPVVTSLDAKAEPGAVVVSGAAEDAADALTRIEVAVDDGDWRPVTPEGGFADAPKLGFTARVPDVTAGPHSVAVRVVDLAGNTAARSVAVTVPKR